MTLRWALIMLVAAVAGAAQAQEPAGGSSAAQRLSKIVGGEPSIREVQRWALEHHRLEPSRLRSMASAARWKGLVPEVEGTLDNSLGHSFSNSKDGLYPVLPSPAENPNPQSYKDRVAASNDQLTWRVRAVWNLDRLAFNSEALDVTSLTSLQETLVREVTTLYFERRRLIAGVVFSPPTGDQELYFELSRIEEITATIDALTGGKFAPRAWSWER